MAPFIAALLQGGLSLVANAALAKGKEFVEEKTGVKLEPQMSPENLLKLKQFELEHEEELLRLKHEDNRLDLEAMKVVGEVARQESQSITQRWQADMTSDSWLSKNIRPMTLIYILTIYTFMAFGSGLKFDITPTYVELLGQWGMLVMTAYFGGRTFEKIADIRRKK